MLYAKRHRYVVFLSVATIVTILSAMVTTYATEVNWRKFAGETIYGIAPKHPSMDAIIPHIPEFEKLTGMKVEFEVLPEIQSRQKLVVQLASRSGQLDFFNTSLHVEKKGFYGAGWYVPLNDFLNDPTLTPPEYDWEDFTEGIRAMNTQPDGTITSLPLVTDPHILYYRKDIFKEKGIPTPKTLDEVEQAAKKLHDPSHEFYGYVSRGLKYANTPVWAYVMFQYGGDFFDEKGEPAINSPAGVKALEWYSRMLRNYGPPGVTNFNWYECSATFMLGKAALYNDGIGFAAQFEDPTKSKVVGKTGYTVFPAGPGGHYAGTFGNAWSVAAYSGKKEAAYLFCVWASNKTNTMRVALNGVGVGRISVLTDPNFQAKSPMPPDWHQAFAESLKIARLGLPEIAAVSEFRDIVGIAIVKAIEGGDPKTLLDKANKEFRKLLLRTEPKRYK